MKKNLLHKIWDIFSYVLLAVVVIGGTIFAYYYAIGYRFNPISGEVKQTGVLNIQTTPQKLEIFLNGKDIGKSPKVTSVDQGSAKVRVEKEGYTTWEKEVPIVAEKSTSVFPTLFLTNPQAESIYSTPGKIISQQISPANDAILALILVEKEYRIIRYELNKQFWNLSDNPTIPYKTPVDSIKSISMSISSDGKWALITKVLENKTKTYELAKLNIPFQTITETGLEEFNNDYSMKWSSDSNFLILESKSDIITYRVSDSTKYLVLKKAPKTNYIWNTVNDGFFYYTSLEKADNLNKFSIIQTTLQGNNKKTILKDIYFQTNDSKVQELKSSSTLSYEAIKNSKDEQQFSGELISFEVMPKSQGVFISTTKATYWYSQEDNNYILIHPSPSQFISTSPDQNKLIYFDPVSKAYFSFTFTIIPEDPTTKIGTNQLLQGDNISVTHWSKDSQDIFFRSNEDIVSIEYDGTNQQNIVKYLGSFGFSDNLEYLYTISTVKEKDTLEVLRYRMY